MEPTFSTRWFYANMRGEQIATGRQSCAVCGLPMDFGEPLSKVLRPTFTDQAVLRAQAGCACAACAWYFGQQELRRSSWWLTAAQAKALDKADIYALLSAHLAEPPDEAGYYLITTMKRKHLALYAPLNMAGASVRRVRFEVVNLDMEPDVWLEVTDAAYRLREHHSWSEIQSDVYYSKALADWPDAVEFVYFRDVIRPWLKTSFLDLVQYAWIRKETTNGGSSI